MEFANEKSSLKINDKCMKKPDSQVEVKNERGSDIEEENEIALLYADHEIKQEMVIGPEVLHKPIYNSSCSKDEPVHKKPKNKKTNQDEPRNETTKEIGTKEEITVSDADVSLHKKPRLQKEDSGSSSDSEDLLVDRNLPPEKKAKIADDKVRTWDLEWKKLVQVREFMGKWWVDIRQFYEKNGELLPGRKGICLTPEQWRQILSVVDEINEAVSNVCANIEKFGAGVRQKTDRRRRGRRRYRRGRN